MRRISVGHPSTHSTRPDALRQRHSHHNPTLYPHLESPDDELEIGDEDGEEPNLGSWDKALPGTTPRRPKNVSYPSASSVPSVASSSSVRSQRSRLRQSSSYGTPAAVTTASTGSAANGAVLPSASAGGKDASSRYQTAFAQFTRRYRRDPTLSYDDYGDDPDKMYFGRSMNDMDGSDDEDSRSGWAPSVAAPAAVVAPKINSEGLVIFDRFSGDGFTEGTPVIPETAEERERLEWQTMLASVLEGDVLRMEKTRIGATTDGSEENKKQVVEIWIGLRARLRGRSEEDERKRVEERRLRTVDAVVEDILHFKVQSPDQPSLSTGATRPPALTQVFTLLERLDVAESLYPSLKAMRADNPKCETSEFKERTDALTSWVTMVTTLRGRIASIQKWTGSETMDVYQPCTSQEAPLRPHTAPAQEMQDESTFVERVLKEDSLQRTFERATLVTSHAVIENARETILTYATLFHEMGLPGVEPELVQLIAFPTKLMEATLRVRLDYASKVNEPSVLVVDQMLEDFRLSIALACTIKGEYESFMEPDDNEYWNLPACISEEYDEVLLEALRFLFKLIHWKLKTASRIYFKEVEVLEAQWALFNEVSMVTDGGSLLVAEHICSVTHRLMSRVTSSFESQLRLPVYKPGDGRAGTSPKNSRPRLERANATPALKERERPMDEEEIIEWYNKVLESVRLRYRKLQRFGRVLTQRFTNAAEYSLASIPLDRFIDVLVETEHLLVYSEAYEEDGIYIIADTSLRNRPYLIHDILYRAFQPAEGRKPGAAQATDGSGLDNDDEDEAEASAPYLLLVTPADRFVWTGDVMVFETPRIDLELEQKRVRLVADGPQARLSSAKERFTEIILSAESTSEEEEAVANGTSGGHESPPPPDYCVVPLQAHHPRVDRELRKITRATNKLAEAITKSVLKVSDVLQGVDKRQELLANWYAFAAENGQSAQKHMDRATWSKFNRELMRLAISYVSFICDECDPTDRRTFRWAVNALEFATLRTRGSNILNLPESEFNLLRSKVATCMTLLISHFDILGARSNMEAQKEQERMSQIRRLQEAQAKLDDDEMARQPPPGLIDPMSVSNWAKDRSIRLNRDDSWLRQLQELDAHRQIVESEQRIAGKVVNDERPEDKSLVFLASSSSNIAMRWQQGRLIGTGAFGSVYLGVNLDSGSMMAVKEIRFTDVTSLTTLYKNVKDELSVMEMLSHPNIVEYYGIEVHRDKVYIFEEYCQGGSLGALLEHGRIEDERITQVYTLQMLEGLAYLHSKNVVHRDIKPDNILLDHMGVIKYVDFGAAKILGKNQRSMAMRTRGSAPPLAHHAAHAPGPVPFPPGFGGNSLTGTPMYMSPEVIKNDKRGRQGAMDIWSLGCVVLECATGRKPWSNLDNEWAIMFHIGVATKHPPLPEPGQLSESGIDFIRRCLTLDPMKRPSANELMDHPWIAEFRDEIMEYEEEDAMSLTTPSMTTGSHASMNEHFELASVARQAHKIEEKDTAAMQSESPPEVTIEGTEDGILVA